MSLEGLGTTNIVMLIPIEADNVHGNLIDERGVSESRGANR